MVLESPGSLREMQYSRDLLLKEGSGRGEQIPE